MNTEQSSPNSTMIDSENSNNYPRDNPVAQIKQSGATAGSQDNENVSETSSANQRGEERIIQFDIVFEIKMRLEQARFEQRRPEL